VELGLERVYQPRLYGVNKDPLLYGTEDLIDITDDEHLWHGALWLQVEVSIEVSRINRSDAPQEHRTQSLYQK